MENSQEAEFNRMAFTSLFQKADVKIKRATEERKQIMKEQQLGFTMDRPRTLWSNDIMHRLDSIIMDGIEDFNEENPDNVVLASDIYDILTSLLAKYTP